MEMLLRKMIIAGTGIFGGLVLQLWGRWNAAMISLCIFMVVDYITGVIVAGVFKKSGKTQTGSLSSVAGWKGLCRKGGQLLIVIVAYQLDILMKTQIIRDVTIMLFCANECISIIENAGMMGIPIPKVMKNAIELLKDNAEAKEEIPHD